MIVAAAILKDGKIHTGKHHDEILNNADPPGSLKGGEQGFVNENGEFFNRYDAADVAYFCGQIPKPKKILYSEDLQ